jgi:peptide/nickel transport system permease protein
MVRTAVERTRPALGWLFGHPTARLLLANPQVAFGLVVLTILLSMAFLAPFIAPHDPAATDILNRLKPPSWNNLFGTDGFGRDVFSRVVHGAQYSVAIGVLTMAATTLIGGALGLVSGYVRGIIDLILMRLMEALMAIPAILLAIALLAILGNNFGNIIIALSVAYVPRLARIVRSLVLIIREELYVESARAIGARPMHIIIHYILPQVTPAILVQTSFIVAGLSFLGVALQPPAPSWGGILSEGRSYMAIAPWMTIFPGLGIMLIVLGLNQLGDGLRDVLDPRLRKFA